MSDARWAQLTYTSFDSGTGGAGGWGVKDSTGGITDSEIEGIRSRIATSVEST